MDNVDDYFDEFAEHTLRGVPVIVDAPDTDFNGGDEFVIASDVQITYATKRLALKSDDRVILIEIETNLPTPYKVRSVRAYDDGKTTRAGLLKVLP